MPGYIAWVYVYGLASQLAQQDGVFNRWNEEDFRPTYYDKLVSGVDAVVQSIETIDTEPEVIRFEEETDAVTLPTGEVDDTAPTDSTESDAEVPAGGETYVSPFESNEVQPMEAEPTAKALRTKA